MNSYPDSTPSLDDTQPNRPVVLPNSGDYPDASAPGSPGCGLMGLVGGIVLIFSILIVALSGAAGWTAGQREANVNATATQGEAINDQITRIPGDIAEGNIVLLDTRLRYLATLTPGVAGMAEFSTTATALFQAMQPTASPTNAPPTATLAASQPAPIAPTASLAASSTPPPGGQYDLAALLQEAEADVNTAQWQNAVELLDAISAVDSTFQAQRVRQLMGQALNSYALQLYQNDQPAAANIIVGRAEELGVLQGDLGYERYVAELYLNARAGAALGSPAALADLQRIINEGAGGRYYSSAIQLLYDLYIRQGDAWVAQGEYCPAVPIYQNAVNLLSSGAASGKLSIAQQFCAQATPISDPMNPFMPGDPNAPTPIPGFVPIGQSG